MDHPKQESQNVYQKLYDFLTHEYGKASTIEIKNDIRECADVVLEARLTEDGTNPLATDLHQLKALAQLVLAKLQKLQKDGLADNVDLEAYIRKILEIVRKIS